jgi:hypothetical protein
MWPNKIKKRGYEIAFVFCIIFILLSIVFTNQFLQRTLTILNVTYPSKVKVGETFNIYIEFNTTGSNLITYVQAYTTTGQVGSIGPYSKAVVYMQKAGRSNVTLAVSEPFGEVSQVDLVVEFLSPIGLGLASKTYQIAVEPGS